MQNYVYLKMGLLTVWSCLWLFNTDQMKIGKTKNKDIQQTSFKLTDWGLSFMLASTACLIGCSQLASHIVMTELLIVL